MKFVKKPRRNYSYPDCRCYGVILDGVEIGEVKSVRKESWRTTQTGVRYSMIGAPKTWEFCLSGTYIWWHGGYSRRDAADRLLIERIKKARGE